VTAAAAAALAEAASQVAREQLPCVEDMTKHDQWPVSLACCCVLSLIAVSYMVHIERSPKGAYAAMLPCGGVLMIHTRVVACTQAAAFCCCCCCHISMLLLLLLLLLLLQVYFGSARVKPGSSIWQQTQQLAQQVSGQEHRLTCTCSITTPFTPTAVVAVPTVMNDIVLPAVPIPCLSQHLSPVNNLSYHTAHCLLVINLKFYNLVCLLLTF
jgi:hypothetical protein